jgi:hypothetical protein
MKNKFKFLVVAAGVLLLNCNSKKSFHETGKVKFYVDPATNSEDPDIRMAYGLNIVPPWPDGGSIFVLLPEHLEYMPETQGIARHHDKRTNVWQANADSTEANYAVESLTEPGVFLSVKAMSIDQRATFEMTITNRSEKILRSIRPMFCHQYNLLKGFPGKNTNNFAHTFIIINGKLVPVESLVVKKPDAYVRMAQVSSCVDEHNWWAEEMGGFIEQRMDEAYTIITAANDDRKVILHWAPGKNLLTNANIPCIHSDPCIGDLAPGESRTVHGELIFTRTPLKEIINEFPPVK